VKVLTSRKTLRLLGIAAIVGAIGSAMAEETLFYLPGQGIEFDEYTLLQNVSHFRLALGHYLGIFVFPLQLFGFWQIYQALKPAGKWFSLPVFLLASYSWICCIALYGSFAYMSTSLQVQQTLTGEAQDTLIRAIELLKSYHEPMFFVFFILCFATWLWYSIAIAFRDTLYPKWMAFFNPILLCIIVLSAGNYIPTLGRFIGAAFYNLAMILFFTISTWVLWSDRSEIVTKSIEPPVMS
jgi:hypothetical protein